MTAAQDLVAYGLLALLIGGLILLGSVFGWCAHSVRRWHTGRAMAARLAVVELELAEARTDRDRLLEALAALDSGPVDAVLDAVWEGPGEPPALRARHRRPSAIRPYLGDVPPATRSGRG